VSQYVRKIWQVADRVTIACPDSADCLNHAFETSDIAEICKAIGVVTHRHNILDIAKKAGIERSSLYRAFAGKTGAFGP
jgi:probable addiction module antidote protein